MGFGTDLWDKLPEVSNRTEEGLKNLNDFCKFVQDLSKLQGNFGKDVQKLCRTTHKSCFGKKRTEQGTNRDSFAAVLREMDAVAVHHINAANLLNETVAGPLAAFIKEKDRMRGVYLNEAKRLSKELENGYSHLQRVQKSYQRACKDAEAAQVAYERADADPNFSVLTVEKFQSKAQIQSQKARTVDEEYASAVDVTNRLQADYYQSLFPKVLDDLQELDVDRINQYQTMLRSVVGIHLDLLPNLQQTFENIGSAADSVDAMADIQMFVNENMSVDTPPSEIIYTAEPFIAQSGGGARRPSQPTSGIGGPAAPALQQDLSNMTPKELQSALEQCKKDIVVQNKTKTGIETLLPCYGEGSEAQRQVMGQIEDCDRKINELHSRQSEIEALLGVPGGGSAGAAGGYDQGGYDQQGQYEYNQNGYDQNQGYDQGGYNQGYDQGGYNNQAQMPPPPPAAAQPEGSFSARALYEYAPTSDGELGFGAGEILTITSQDASGWWVATLNGQSGLVPSNYLEAC